LSLFNIVSFDRNALGPAIFHSQYAIVEEFLNVVLQPAIRGADNIVISKFPSFHEFFSVLESNRSNWGIQWVAKQFKTSVSGGGQCL